MKLIYSIVFIICIKLLIKLATPKSITNRGIIFMCIISEMKIKSILWCREHIVFSFMKFTFDADNSELAQLF